MLIRDGAKKYIESDLYRYAGTSDTGAFLRQYLRNRSFRWQVAFRLRTNCIGMGLKQRLVRALGLVLWVLNTSRHSIQIPVGTQIGYGLYLSHGGPVVVNPTAIIGNNVNLSQFTTIGSNEGKAGLIGDNVYIGPGVSIVENVHIGNNATIGAGSVVTKDIPDNATAAGNYAKVLNYNNPGRFIMRRWNVCDETVE